jgi:putative SOS response-associated peptidase YedK
MCGRFNFLASPQEVTDTFRLTVAPPPLPPRYNVAPTQKVAVVAEQVGTGARKLGFVRWGLVPAWSNGPAGPPLVNARSETADRLPSFRDCFAHKRCLIPASGFYEWAAVGGKKMPHLFRPADGRLMAFAGLWEIWGDGPDREVSCCILTTTANDTVRPFHDRMPVVLTPDHFGEWFDTDATVDRLKELLVPAPTDRLTVLKLKPVVSSVRNDGPACLEAA